MNPLSRIFLVLVTLCLAFSSSAQVKDPYLRWKIHDSMKHRFIELFPRDLDSARAALNYWQDRGYSWDRTLHIAQLMMSMAEGKPIGGLLSESSLDHYRFSWHSPMADTVFGRFVATYFERQYRRLDPGTDEFVIAEYYAHDRSLIFERLQDSVHSQTQLARLYRKRVARYLNKPDAHAALIVGAWFPTGGIRRLGTHPLFGLQFGVKHRKWNYDLTLLSVPGKSANSYHARRVRSDDSVVLSNAFASGYLGFDLGYDIYNNSGNELQLLAGAGVDGFDAIRPDTVRGLKGETTWTYNFNFGLGYRHYISNTAYVGLRAKYNIVDYTLRNIVEFTGNPITVSLVIGGLWNDSKKEMLRDLKYKWRRAQTIEKIGN